MSSCVSRQRRSISEMQPFCWIMSGAHSFFQTRKAASISDGSIVMWMSRIMAMGFSHQRYGNAQRELCVLGGQLAVWSRRQPHRHLPMEKHDDTEKLLHYPGCGHTTADT